MHDPEEGGGGYATGETGDLAGLEIDDHGVPKTFCHECDMGVVGGEIGSFAKRGENGDVGGEVVEGIADESFVLGT